jgi:hypothetical protein
MGAGRWLWKMGGAITTLPFEKGDGREIEAKVMWKIYILLLQERR